LARSSAENQRLQARARATTATASNPTNLIMMVPIPGGGGRNGIGPVWSGRMLFMKLRSLELVARAMMPALGRRPDPASSKVQPNIIVIPGRA
jgi:hypothetical protein